MLRHLFKELTNGIDWAFGHDFQTPTELTQPTRCHGHSPVIRKQPQLLHYLGASGWGAEWGAWASAPFHTLQYQGYWEQTPTWLQSSPVTPWLCWQTKTRGKRWSPNDGTHFKSRHKAFWKMRSLAFPVSTLGAKRKEGWAGNPKRLPQLESLV